MKRFAPQPKFCAQLLTDFANAKDTDDAVRALIERCRHVFGYSPDFLTRARKAFPRRDTLKPFLHERKLDSLNWSDVQRALKDVLGEPLSAQEREQYDRYLRIAEFHRRIAQLRERVRQTLEGIANGTPIHKNDNLYQFITSYPNTCEQIPLVNSDGTSFWYEPLYMMEHLCQLQGSPTEGLEVLATAYERIITFCVVTFARSARDRKLVYRCHKCPAFFVRSAANDRYIYCQNCSRKDNRSREEKSQQQRNWRRRKREEKKRQLYEAKVENLMSNLGCTREDAEDTIKADLELERSK